MFIAQVCFGLIYYVALMPAASFGFDGDLESEIQSGLAESRSIVLTMQHKLQKGAAVNSEISGLKAAADDIRITNLLLEERFKLREEKVKALGSTALSRQQAMVEGYRKALIEYLTLIDNLPSDGTIRQSAVNNLKSLLDKLVPKKKRPIIGSLPYKHLNYPAQEPSSAPTITPAYKGGNKTVSPDDTAATSEAPISNEIATLAQSLNWQPVLIYEYVKNNIETEWYWGCMKGAEETLHQKSGNDCDQATLLTALLRASGFPARYVRGTIEFFPDIERAKHLSGIDDPAKIAEFFQKAGIPYKTVIAGGKIANIQIEHVWVESQIPYANYRGIVIDEHGKTWLGLDTSIKVKGYTYNNAPDILSTMSLSTIRDEYLGLSSSGTGSTPFELNQTPLEYLQARINSELQTQNSPLLYADFLRTRTLLPEVLNILPSSMQFTLIQATNEYTTLPDELIHKVRFLATVNSQSETPLLDITLPLYKLSNQQIAISYEPETVEDQETIDSYGGLDNTPAYLVHLRPMLKINGERIIVAQDGLSMGSEYDLTIELMGAGGTDVAGSELRVEKTTNTMIAGNLTAIGIVGQRAAVTPSPLAGEGGGEGTKDAERLLYESAQHYIDRWNQAEDELASLLLLTLARPLPAVVTLGSVFDITYFLGVPHGLTWKGEYIDADLRSAETVASDESRVKTFMQLSSLQGSILENRIFEDDFQVDSISTAKLIQLVTRDPQSGSAVLTIDKTNIDTILTTLALDDNIMDDITNAVNQNSAIRIPQSEMNYLDWTGIGYVKENIETKESGWMLSGMIAGGMTAVSPDAWPDQSLGNILGNPYQNNYKTVIITDPLNDATVTTTAITVTGYVVDPSSTVTVNGIPADMQGNIFTATISLVSGANKITATAVTAAGVRTTDTIVITCNIPVKVYITYPYDGAELSVTPIYVEGFVSDPLATVTVNNAAAAVTNDGRFLANAVALTEGANQITATAVNKRSEADTSSITVQYHAVQPQPALTVTITTPTDGTTINKPETTVIGTITTTADEAWVTVNGMPATIYNNQFVVNSVPLIDGSNRIIVNAMDSNGAMGRAEATVTTDTTAPYVQLNANITSGTSSLTAYFTVSTALSTTISDYQMDFEGDGTTDYSGAAFDSITHSYTAEGIYYPKITVTDSQGNMYTDDMAIVVLSRTQLDTLLKAKWEGLKAALAGQDIDDGLSYFNSSSQQLYRDIFTSLSTQLPQLVQDMKDIQFIFAKNGTVQYRIRRDQIYGGQLLTITYYIYFALDENGVWKIARF